MRDLVSVSHALLGCTYIMLQLKTRSMQTHAAFIRFHLQIHLVRKLVDRYRKSYFRLQGLRSSSSSQFKKSSGSRSPLTEKRERARNPL